MNNYTQQTIIGAIGTYIISSIFRVHFFINCKELQSYLITDGNMFKPCVFINVHNFYNTCEQNINKTSKLKLVNISSVPIIQAISLTIANNELTINTYR